MLMNWSLWCWRMLMKESLWCWHDFDNDPGQPNIKERWLWTAQELCRKRWQSIELFSRKRWTTGSATQSNMKIAIHVLHIFGGYIIHTTAYDLGWYRLSTKTSTKALHDQSVLPRIVLKGVIVEWVIHPWPLFRLFLVFFKQLIHLLQQI